MRVLDLFSGIGGFSLAAHWMGWETIGFSEVDPYCCKVLAKNFPGVKNYGDIRNMDGRTITADLITGGFPCQPWSLAGKRQGEADARHLWPEMARVIAECKPTWVVAENVPGIIGMALESVCLDLESLGYEVAPVVIPACAVNAPHRRDRVWIIAHAGSDNGKARSLCQREQTPLEYGFATDVAIAANLTQPRNGRLSVQSGRSQQASAEFNGNSETVPHTNGTRLSERLQGRFASVQGETEQSSWSESSRTYSKEDWSQFPTESPFCGGVHGLPHRMDRIKALGNAIVPQVAYEIFQALFPSTP